MGSEAATGDSKMLEEAKTRLLPPSASPLSRSTSSPASLQPSPPNDSLPRSKSEGDLSFEQGTISTPAPAHTPLWSMVSASPPLGLHSSPPVQTMEPHSTFDPDRIPASVFSSQPANASDWSTASNDSLFSIHMANNSLTIDHWNISPISLHDTQAKSHELCSLPPLMEVPANEEGSAKSSNASSFEKEDPIDSPKVTRGASTPCLSNESGQSNRSFAFPILETISGKGRSLERVVEEEKTELQLQTQQECNATAGGWFSCLSCCPRCC